MPCKEDLDIFLAWVKPTLELLPEHWKHLANIVENIHQNFHTSNSDDHTIKQSLAILGLNAAIKADNHALVSLFQEAIKMPLIVAANTHFLSRILQYKNAVFRQNNAEADQTKISKLNRLLVSFYNFGMANTSLQGKDWIKQWLIEQTSQGMNPLAVLRQNVAISLFKFSFLDLIIEYAGPLSRPENQPQEPQPATHQSRTANP
ncbi:MAG: hypothetical protein HWD59_04940 [Coxiellaceae bacterium]|nr:MAG: hypothetical protein HWD59_04940 [Coxiellaceae bacterium]